MKIHQGIANFENNKPVVLTTGTFDGIHLGHQKMLNNLITEAKAIDGESVLLTFYPHPRMILYPDDHGLELLSSPEEKYSLLEELGIDHLIIQPFTEEFSSVTGENYIRDILVNQIGIKKIIVGYDHRFGKNREGNYDTLTELSQTFNYTAHQIPAKEIKEVKISSTKIRNALKTGKVEVAAKYLGRNYHLKGKVVQGEKLGTQIGFPTANIATNYDYKLIPSPGVYAIIATINDDKINAMLNIGTKPTVSSVNQLSIEAHLINWNGMIYENEIEIEFVKWLRPEQKFNSISELIEQLKIDKVETLKILNQ